MDGININSSACSSGRFIRRQISDIVKHRRRMPAKTGQAMIEYVVIAAILMSAVVMLSILLYTFKQHGGRSLDLVASEYP